ncbi:MAG: hypothetical protein D6797_05090 [Bdellovibrio sp.]|nr:MAG: hypothetical protein D6797_05090 [Bdellovibrio sp.]
MEHYAYVKKYASGKQASLGRNARKFMAILYEKTGQYVKAARSFESYAAYNTKDRVASEFYYNAALIWNGINWYSKALRDFQKYLLLSRGKKKSEVLFLIGSIWEKRRNYSKAIYYFEKYMKSSPQNRLRVIETAFKLGSLYEKLKRKSQAQDWYRKTVLIQRNISRRSRVPVGVNYAAEAKFKLVYKTFEKLRSIRFPRSSSGQARALNKKLSFIQRLKNELKPVIAYDDGPMIVAALTLQGQAFQDLSVSLIKAPIPKEVPKSIRKQYKDSVRKKASEFLSKATESYKVAIQKAYQIDAYGPWLKIAQRELGRINGNKFYDLGFLILEKDIPIGVNQ